MLSSQVALAVVGIIELFVWKSSDPYRQYAGEVNALRDKAEKGDAEAQCQLGVIYFNGKAVKMDKSQAVKWYRKAAERGHAEAQNYLGVCYSEGEGVAKNDREAVRWFKKAAAKGNREAQYNLAIVEKERIANNIVRDLRQARTLAENEREARARRAEEERRARTLADELAKKGIETLINDWLATMRVKKPCDRFWYGGDDKTQLYSVVEWKVLDVDADATNGSGKAIVNIDSSNKGGQPIRVTWTVTARKKGDAWKIYSMEDHSAQ